MNITLDSQDLGASPRDNYLIKLVVCKSGEHVRIKQALVLSVLHATGTVYKIRDPDGFTILLSKVCTEL